MMTIVYEVEGKLYINLTNRCPNHCDFCIRQNGDGAYGSDSLWLEHEPSCDEVMAALAAAEPMQYDEVVFCGYGEPTCRLDILLAVAKEIRAAYPHLSIRLNTNGQASLIAGEDAAPLFAGLFDVVSISLNEANATAYDALCHSTFGEAAFDGILAFAAAVKAFVPQVVFTVVREFLSPDALSACYAISEERGIPLRVRTYISA